MEDLMKIRLIVLLMLLTTLISAQTMWDNPVALRQGVNIEWTRAAVSTDDGGIVYTWSDTKFGGRDLYAMKYDATGNSVWGEEPLLVDGKEDRQEDPVIIKTSDGNYIIAWIDFSLDQDGDVFAQKINNSGELLWQEGGVPVCTSHAVQISLNIVENDVGGAYILWRDSRNPSVDLYAANLDGDGNNLWTENGIPIANSNNPETSNSMREDGDGGFFIGYLETAGTSTNILAKRFNSAGESLWGEPLMIAQNIGDSPVIRVVPDGIGGYIFVWSDQREVTTNIFAQRLLGDGTFDWGDYAEVYSDEDDEQSFAQSYPQAQPDGLGNTIIVWQDQRVVQNREGLFAQKMSPTGAKLWAEDGVMIRADDVEPLTLRIDSDTNGGAYVIWTDSREGQSPHLDIYAQHLTADGSLGWGADAMPICTAINEQNSPLIKKSNEHIFTVWEDARTGSIGISQQIIDSSNNIVLTEDGETVFYGLSGDAGKDGLLQIHPRPNQNDAIVIWDDTRGAVTGYRVFYQLINPDGTYALELNGRPVTIPTGYDQTHFDSATNSAGQTLIVWAEQRAVVESKIFAQLIDTNGDYLWGDTGLELSPNYSEDQGIPKVSCYNDDFYIGWAENFLVEGMFPYKQVHGQRISNGEKQWGEHGIRISGAENGAIDTEMEIHNVIGNHYIWNVYGEQRRVVRVNEDGEVVEGYSVEGNMVTSPGVTVYANDVGNIHNDQLYYSWIDDRDNGTKTIFTQGFELDGTFSWTEGLNTSLQDHDGEPNEADYPDMAIGDAVYVTWSESSVGGNHNIMAQKITFDGEKEFADGGAEIAVNYTLSQEKPKIARVSNDYYLVAWEQQDEDEIDLYMNLLRYNGDRLYGSTGTPITQEIKSQVSVRIAPLGDGKAILAWADGVSSGKTTILGVYTQYVDFSSVSNDDNEVQVASNKLLQNYPNPFNPTTTISFSLEKDAKDVELAIYNLKGQKVKTLIKDSFTAGNYSFVWNGDNDDNKAVSSGVYFYKLKAGSQTATKKMVLMK